MWPEPRTCSLFSLSLFVRAQSMSSSLVPARARPLPSLRSPDVVARGDGRVLGDGRRRDHAEGRPRTRGRARGGRRDEAVRRGEGDRRAHGGEQLPVGCHGDGVVRARCGIVTSTHFFRTFFFKENTHTLGETQYYKLRY